ncbi:type I polyketide synthase [Streptomyces luteireticuli]|uniref:SDR family NAD(P)-dependent oxidoreductase n=1 Tax=Streptomyces luteireticuli TaxID=173858 RepID=A0ABN0YZP5_9ACTN
MSASQEVPIAIIGIGCRFPGGVESAAGLWDLLVEGRDTVGPVPAGRWDARRLAAFQDPDLAGRLGRGCFLEQDVWAWDPEAMAVARPEQRWVDPQFRVLMEVAWEAAEHAGVPVDRMRGSRTGVYVGAYAPDNLFREARPVEDALDPVYMFGNFTGTLVGRLAFGMDLRGPVMALNTMCSSGLVAVDTACGALALEECDMALAGAVLLLLSPETHHLEAPLLLSRRGRCYAFDARADGYVRGEGAGMLLLKRLADARRDGDRVLAVIRGSAVNNDGQATRLTAPSTQVQQELFRAAVERAGIDPGDVGLVEAHGPGTAVGDPIEYTSVDAVYGRGRGRCALGSVKTNIGHSEPASGIAGAIKAVQCLRHGMVPANLNFRDWSPAIERDGVSRLFVPVETSAWPVAGGPRLAAVCSYGVTGTNAHAVLEQAPAVRSAPRRRGAERGARGRKPARAAYLLPLSGASPEAVSLAAGRLAAWAGDAGARSALADVAHTLAVRRWHGAQRLGVAARTSAELTARLRDFTAGEAVEGLAAGGLVLPSDHRGPVLVFSGQGSQWAGMCRGLLRTEPVFTAALAEVEPLIRAESGFSVRRMLTEPHRLTGVDRIQPTLFAVQFALAALWRSWGVRPAAVIGQSMGEVTAAVVAGALSPPDGAAVICRRARLLAETAGGAMASVLLGADRVAADIAAAGADQVEVAVLTSPGATVISGDAGQTAALVAGWQERDIVVRMVDVDVASHSPQMDPVLGRLHDVLDGLRPLAPRAAFYSTVCADPRDAGPLDAAYWVHNQREMVRFHGAVAAALADGHRLFVECAPHPLAVRAIADIARHASVNDAVAVGSLRRGTDDQDAYLSQVAAVHCAGFPLDWAARYGDGELVEAPGTAWRRVRTGGDGTPYRLVAPHLVGAAQHPLLGGHVHDPDRPGRHMWQTPVGPARLPWLADHRVAEVPVLPGAGLAEMMLAAASRAFGTDHVAVTALDFTSPLVLDPEPLVTTQVLTEGDRARVEIRSAAEEGTQLHAEGLLRPLEPRSAAGLPPVEAPPEEWEDVPPEDVHRYFRQRHSTYHGPAFAALERIQLHPGADRAVARLRIADAARVSGWTMALHPALLDEFVQTVASVWLSRYVTSPGPVVVAGFEEIRVHGPTGHTRLAEVRLHKADDVVCTASGVLATADGTVVAEIDGLRLANVTPPEERFASRLAHTAWVAAPRTARDTGPAGRWLVVAEEGDAWPGELAEALRARAADCRILTARRGHDLLADELTAILRSDARAWSGVVLAATGGTDGGAAPAVARGRVARARTVVRALSELADPPRLWAVTRGGGPAPDTAGLRGLLRVAAYEHPRLAPSMIDLDPPTDPRALLDDLLDEERRVSEIAWRDGERFTARVRPGAPVDGSADGRPRPPVRPGAAYLVTGGLGALGLLTAGWLAGHGAGHIVLCGRTAPSGEAESLLATAREAGASVSVVLGDIADPAVAAGAVRTATATGTPLKGVVHAAGVVEDATLANLDDLLLERVWRGKADGAWALHHATLDHDLDFWVVYSSVASLLGSPGQGAYAAANAFTDDLVAWRHHHKLPATTIHWGPWGRVGRGKHLAERGFVTITPADGIDALERILTAGYPQIAYSPLDLERWTAPYPAVRRSALLAGLLADDTAQDADSALLEALRTAAGERERRTLLEEHIIDCVREILGGTTVHIGPGSSLVMLGLDSLGAVGLRVRLEKALRTGIDPGVIWVRPSPAGLADWVLDRMAFNSGNSATDGAT